MLRLTKRFYSYRLQYVSDIHLEYLTDFPKIKPVAPHLALLGDIGDPFKPNMVNFLSWVSQNWEKTFFIAGNHEYWQKQKTMREVDEQITKIVNKFNNIYFLNRSCHQITPDIKIIGCTLWSQILKQPQKIIGDDANIFLVNWNILNKQHKIHVDWLTSELSIENEKIIVLTHHLPSYRLILGNYKKSVYQDRFATDLEHLINKPVIAWLSGHSHIVAKVKINNIDCSINAWGYQQKNLNRQEKIIEID